MKNQSDILGEAKIVLLQCKFILVAWLNVTSGLLPNPLRRWYLRCFGIKIGRESSIHRGCKFFHVGKFSMGVGEAVRKHNVS